MPSSITALSYDIEPFPTHFVLLATSLNRMVFYRLVAAEMSKLSTRSADKFQSRFTIGYSFERLNDVRSTSRCKYGERN